MSTDLESRSRELLERARTEPDRVDVSAIEPLLEADDGHVRHDALRAATLIADDEPDRLRPIAGVIRARVDDPYPVASSTAMMALSLLGESHPDAVRPVAPTIVDHLDDPSPGYRFRAASALVPLAEPYPEFFVERADVLVDRLVAEPVVTPIRTEAVREENLSPDRIKTREKAREADRGRSIACREILAHLLVHVANVRPDALADRLEEIADELEAAEPSVREALVDVFGHVAEADLSTVELPIDRTVALLEDDDPTVRARAIRTLGFAGAADAVDSLRAVAESDDDEAVAEFARETADWLAETE
ncbi:HEAT repeat domain-containing protein [Natrarchaeobius oligotrophus]|uniref:HEAT repeat domain-containing protein n=1 Tax=Natrarchaeobius chitinivorans TaxID=1679083 RepID=A0A3N6M6H9_NATCH|nr:HEAT repeat domain-containing protein [Natrarchaeobius chitinivorans]RQG99188.1 hypothetical protein EA472_15065 [Natrarchaeobius chitinivorans]